MEANAQLPYLPVLIIFSSSIFAQLCTYNASTKEFQLTPDGPFTISMSNKFVALGCHIVGMYKYEDDVRGDVKKPYNGLYLNLDIIINNCSTAHGNANFFLA